MFEIYEKIKICQESSSTEEIFNSISVENLRELFLPLTKYSIECYGFRISPTTRQLVWAFGGSIFLDFMRDFFKKYQKKSPSNFESVFLDFLQNNTSNDIFLNNVGCLWCGPHAPIIPNSEKNRILMRDLFPNDPNLYSKDELTKKVGNLFIQISNLESHISHLEKNLDSIRWSLEKTKSTLNDFSKANKNRRKNLDMNNKALSLKIKIDRIGNDFEAEVFYRFFSNRLTTKVRESILTESLTLSDAERDVLYVLFNSTRLNSYQALAEKIRGS